MLEELSTIDWSQLNHAYGPATDVPDQLRALAFGTPKTRKRALSDLHGNIWHQHTIYEATHYAVPFLLELVQNQVPDYIEILGLLALIANGTSYLEAHREYQTEWTDDVESNFLREMEDVRLVRKALAKRGEVLTDLLNSKNRRVREICIFILGSVGRGTELAPSVVENILSNK